jgi:Uma2 family endonuclease
MVLSENQISPIEKEIIYPESDGKPMADNSRQWSWMVYIKEGYEIVYKDAEVFVAGDMLWYPVKGEPEIRQAPDTMIAIGRPKGHRGSYKQWEEGGIAPQVVFEVWSPGSTQREMNSKRKFYERYGVVEYYEYDPDRLKLRGWIKQGENFVAIQQMSGWVSPLTKVRFELDVSDKERELKLYQVDGKPFLTFMELTQARDTAEQALQVETELCQREAELRRQAENRARVLVQERDAAEQKLQELLAKLQARGIDLGNNG